MPGLGGSEDSMKVECGKSGLTISRLKMAPVLIISAMTIIAAAIAAGSVIIPLQHGVTLTGIVSDSVCGSDHGIKAPGDAECTRSCVELGAQCALMVGRDRKSTRLNSSHMSISYAVFCLKK